MPQQTDPAVPTRLSKIDDSLVGRKLRVVGRSVPSILTLDSILSIDCARMLSYDLLAATVLLQHNDAAVLVDVSLCVDPKTSGRWIREKKDVISVVGYLERSPVRD